MVLSETSTEKICYGNSVAHDADQRVLCARAVNGPRNVATQIRIMHRR